MGRPRGPATLVSAVDRHRIVDTRRARGWSAKDLARAAGLHPSTVYRLERGELTQTRHLPHLYKILDLPAAQIGRADADEDELLAAYREIRSGDPAQAARLIGLARYLLARSSRLRAAGT